MSHKNYLTFFFVSWNKSNYICMARLHILNSKLPIIRHIVICCVWFKGNVHQVISVTELHTKSISVCFNHQLTFSILQISTHQVKWLMKYCIWKYNKWLRLVVLLCSTYMSYYNIIQLFSLNVAVQCL